MNGPRSPELPTFQQHLAPPLRHIDGIDITRRFDTKPSPRASRRSIFCGRSIDVFARVELERGLGAENVQMQLRARVRGADQRAQRPLARVERDVGRVRVDDETVVDVRVRGAQHKGLAGFDAREVFNCAQGNVGLVDWEMFGCVQCHMGAFDGRPVGDVEVAGPNQKNVRLALPPWDSCYYIVLGDDVGDENNTSTIGTHP